MWQFVEVLGWFLRLENAKHWAAVQQLAAENTPKADDTIRAYVLEAQRLTSSQRNLRISKVSRKVSSRNVVSKEIEDVQINPGDPVVCLLVS